MDSRERFTGLAGDYARWRPDYPDEVAAACAEYADLSPGDLVVDVGAGTGISSRLFARHGFRVVGVEPNPAMRAEAEAAGGGPEYRAGDAAATGLPDGGARLVACFQALHWLDLDEVLPEWARILVPDGACAAAWNLRRPDGWQRDYEALLERASSEYAVARRSLAAGEREERIHASPLCRDVVEREFENAQALPFEGLLGRAMSSSYVRHGVRDLAGFERELRALFDAAAEDGRVIMRYRTYLVLWRITRPTAG